MKPSIISGSAVEFRHRDISRCLAQYLIRVAQFPDLPLLRLQLLQHIQRDAGTAAAFHLGLLDPLVRAICAEQPDHGIRLKTCSLSWHFRSPIHSGVGAADNPGAVHVSEIVPRVHQKLQSQPRWRHHCGRHKGVFMAKVGSEWPHQQSVTQI